MDAFTQLLYQQEKITVSNIARIANIDRKTFYLHYESIDDLIDEFRAEMFASIIPFFNSSSIDDVLSERFIDVIFDTTKDNMELFKIINANPQFETIWYKSSGITAQYYEKVRWSIPQMEKTVFRLYIKSYLNSIITIVNSWISGSIKISEQQAREMCHNIVNKFREIIGGYNK